MIENKIPYASHSDLSSLRTEIRQEIRDINCSTDRLSDSINELVTQLVENSRDAKETNIRMEESNKKIEILAESVSKVRFNVDGILQDQLKEKYKAEGKWEFINSLVDVRGLKKAAFKFAAFGMLFGLISTGTSDFFHFMKQSFSHYFG